jgi:retinol-binding protein 3
MKWMVASLPLLLGQAAALPAHQTADVVHAVGAALKDGYVYEDIGRRLSDRLERERAAGTFDRESAIDLGRTLTTCLRAETNDRHLSVWAPGGEPDGLRLLQGKMIARAEILPGNIGYIDMRTFTGKPSDIDAAVDAVQAAGALIIDLGENLGGSPPIVQYLSSYLFSQRTHLLNVIARGWAQPEERWTLDRVEGQRLPNIPVYVLTSARTFSAAESFAFGLRVTGRAKIIGQTTAGGGHFVKLVSLPYGMHMTVPIGRAYDAQTGKGWQGDGIVPDVKVPYAVALATALKLISQERR